MSAEYSRQIVVAYRPKPGREGDLLQLTREHVPCCAPKDFRPSPGTAGRANDGTIVEVFEWAPGGIERAHSNPAVVLLWERYAAACDYVFLVSLAESSTQFASFAPIDL